MYYSFVALTILPAIATVLADGGFAFSCPGFSLSGTTLVADCVQTNGAIDASAVNLNNCVANDGGILAVFLPSLL